jgi:predicted nucleic acid-binding protein
VTAYLVESSVWVRHLRGASDALSDRLVRLREEEVFVTTEPIAMELLAGASRQGTATVERLLDSMPTLAVDPHVDFRAAARIYRDARAHGQTIRSMIDCLIAAIALRHQDVIVVHDDVDFERIARVTDLRHEHWLA